MTRLLIVDDDTALTTVVAEALSLQLRESHDLEVLTTPGWEGAMTIAEGLEELDVLLVDYHLGPSTGIELSKRLTESFPALRTLLYTGKATAAVEAEARRSGIPVLWKPQRIGPLTTAVKAVIEGREP